MSAIVKIEGGKLAKPKGGGAAIAQIEATVAPLAKPLAFAAQFQECPTYLGEGKIQPGRFLADAKRVLTRLLPRVPEIEATHSVLFEITMFEMSLGVGGISQAVAIAMLGVLYGALKRKADRDDNATLLIAAADMFNPVTQSLGESTRLWKPVSRHPAVLALAIKKLLASQVFSPSPSEIREAMTDVRRHLAMMDSRLGQWLERIDRADAIVFLSDRKAWDAIYATAPANAVAAMLDRASDEGAGDDDNGDPVEPSARWIALNDIVEHQAKLAAPEPPRLAACAVKPAKRTTKARDDSRA
jgi:hypothetical protein